MSIQIPSTTPTTHVIFDHGGIVVDFAVVLYDVFQDIGAQNGKLLPESFKRDITEIESFGQIIDRFLDVTNIDKNKRTEILEVIQDLLFNRIKTKGVQMVSGVYKLIKHLYENNIPMAIATNCPKDISDLIFNNTKGLNRNFFSHCTIARDDPEVKNNKPAPDVYLVCAKRFTTPPKSSDSCVIFEDSICGITGAVNTGMKTVFLNEYKRPKEDFESIVDKITVIIDSFDNFKPESVCLPSYPIE